jgi:hypothetical protein
MQIRALFFLRFILLIKRIKSKNAMAPETIPAIGTTLKTFIKQRYKFYKKNQEEWFFYVVS